MRKINWLNRHAHTALLFLQAAKCGKTSLTLPELYRASDLKVAYGTVNQGINALKALSLIETNKRTVYYDNGMHHRSFKTVVSEIFPDDLDRLVELSCHLYQTGSSVEVVAAVATVTGMQTAGLLKEKNDWFTLKDYCACLNAPQQKTTYPRTPMDAVGLIEYDVKNQRYRRNDRVSVIEPIVTEIDSVVHKYRKAA